MLRFVYTWETVNNRLDGTWGFLLLFRSVVVERGEGDFGATAKEVGELMVVFRRDATVIHCLLPPGVGRFGGDFASTLDRFIRSLEYTPPYPPPVGVCGEKLVDREGLAELQ